jgi:hypothetical protein
VNAPADNADRRGEIKVVLLISLLAALHVFIFSAAFPFFNNVDEQLHFDLAVRYSQAEIPRGLEPLSAEAIRYIVMFSSRAYLTDPATLPDGKLPPPPWTQPTEKILPQLGEAAAQWNNIVSTESTMPPLYYTLAGGWWRAGGALGLEGGNRLYWLRFFNLPIVMGIVWLGWLAARRIFPESFFARIAVPAIVAFMPQTAFYSINNDILAPLVFGAAFLALLKFWEAEIPSVRLAAGLGLALAATFLTKISTLPLLAVAGVFIAGKLFQMARQKTKLRPALPAIVALSLCALLPALAWMLWCKANYGDFTGSAAKIAKLGWTDKPAAEWLAHPIFSPKGIWTFVGDNLATFWQGEFWWLRRPLALPALDGFYQGLTLVLIGVALVALVRRQVQGVRFALWLSCACLAATFAFFALLSVKFDFQDCFYPSRAHPFFTSGRLMLGGLIPLLILCVGGLDVALKKFPEGIKFLVLALLLAGMLAGEIAVDWRVFPCEYNWFHL